MNSTLPSCQIGWSRIASQSSVCEGAVDVGCAHVSRSVEISRMRAVLIGQPCCPERAHPQAQREGFEAHRMLVLLHADHQPDWWCVTRTSVLSIVKQACAGFGVKSGISGDIAMIVSITTAWGFALTSSLTG